MHSCVFNILISPTKVNGKGNVIAYLADMVKLKKINNVTVTQTIVSMLLSYGINFNKVSVFDSITQYTG